MLRIRGRYSKYYAASDPKEQTYKGIEDYKVFMAQDVSEYDMAQHF